MKLYVVCLGLMVSCVSARPRYIAIPVEDIQFLNFRGPALEERSPRVARDVAYELPQLVLRGEAEQAASEARHARQTSGGGGGGHHDDYVDYGAHTGHHGAFGWYADFPVYTHEH